MPLVIGKVSPPTNAKNSQACSRIRGHTARPQPTAHIDMLSVVEHGARTRRQAPHRSAGLEQARKTTDGHLVLTCRVRAHALSRRAARPRPHCDGASKPP
jgi:hypothetical protein